MTNRFMQAAALGLLLASTAVCAKDYAKINRFTSLNELAMMTNDLKIQAETAAGRDQESIDRLDKDLPAALAQAKGDRELTAAVKAYYVAWRAYFDGLEPQTSESVMVYKIRVGQLETEAKHAAIALDVELKARGAGA